MGANLPISVVIPSFNHQLYLEEALESVLSQEALPSEIIVVDDASTDDSYEILKKYGSQISLTRFDQNKGAAIATNTGIRLAEYPYIAILNSDDMWEPKKLKLQYSWMVENNLDVGFTTASIIDKDSTKVSNPPSFFDVFLRTSPIKDSYLYHFFYFGNFLCHPSLLIKKDTYLKSGFYSNKFRQLPDLERWINFAKFNRIGIMDEKLTKFRWTEGLNTSNQHETSNFLRTQNEHLPLYMTFFDGVSDEEIKKVFHTEIEAMEPTMQRIAEVDPGAALLLSHPEPTVKYQTTIAGYLRLMSNETTPEIDKILQNISASFQMNLSQENMVNHFLNQSFAKQNYERLSPSVRKFIRRVIR